MKYLVLMALLAAAGCAARAGEDAAPAQPAEAEGRDKGAAGMDNKPDGNVEKVVKSEADWRKELTPEQYRILREKGTEPAFSGEYWQTKTPGEYLCAACGAELFSSETKFDSHCGWPSFYAPQDGKAVEEQSDNSYGMRRTEVLCSRCGGHLGHVFDDGPLPTGLRYCINSASIKHVPKNEEKAKEEKPAETKSEEQVKK